MDSIYGPLCLATAVALPVARERLPAWARQFAGVLRGFSVAAMPCGTARGTLALTADGQAPLRGPAARRGEASGARASKGRLWARGEINLFLYSSVSLQLALRLRLNHLAIWPGCSVTLLLRRRQGPSWPQPCPWASVRRLSGQRFEVCTFLIGPFSGAVHCERDVLIKVLANGLGLVWTDFESPGQGRQH